MIVRRKSDLAGTPGEMLGASDAHWRFLHEADGLGFTLVEAVLEAGREAVLWYRDHLEANYVIEGEATLEDLATGAIYELGPGSLYALDRHERHRFRTRTRVRLISVFRPALAEGERPNRAGGGNAAPSRPPDA